MPITNLVRSAPQRRTPVPIMYAGTGACPGYFRRRDAPGHPAQRRGLVGLPSWQSAVAVRGCSSPPCNSVEGRPSTMWSSLNRCGQSTVRSY